MKKLKEPIILKQYQEPPVWMEYGMYLGAVLLFAATVVNPGVMLWPGAITGVLLYWNYRLFDLLKKYVQYVNANELNRLIDLLDREEDNEQKDGTFQDTSGLITREDDVHDQEDEG